MNMSPWRVVLLEDDADVRQFFETCIHSRPELELVASFERLAAARQWLDFQTADLLLTDLALPDGHGLTLIKHVAQTQPSCEILVISVFGDEDTVLACVEAGAVGYIQKDTSLVDVGQTIVDIKHGASPISPMIARKVLERLRKQNVPATLVATVSSKLVLTPREANVLELISRGYSYAEIARLNETTLHTVQSHIKNLYSKLAVHSRSEAVFEATRMGLLQQSTRG